MTLPNAICTIINAVRLLIASAVLVGVAGLYPMSQEQAQPQGQTQESTSQQTPTHQTRAAPSITDKNAQYGFCVSLPEEWKGYSIVLDVWEGSADHGPVAHGPIVKIRHPLWVSEVPRQDIPIMIFTSAQWRSVAREKFFVSAAPFGPDELGRNSKFVFAMPPRYNYAFPLGYEEVVEITKSKPLRAPCEQR